MATKKFKKNLISLLNVFETKEELVDFLAKKKAFSEEFMAIVTDSDYLKALKKVDSLNLKEIKEKLHYEICYENNKILVDITKNDVFSYFDTEEELIKKMKNYIKIEDYEKALVMKNYLKTIEIDYL